MAFPVRISARALRDLEQIYESVHADSSRRAFAWFNALSEAIYSLELSPDRGSVTPESKVHRQLLHGKKPHLYRIIYCVEKGVVQIVHIRHGARDAFTPDEV
jgi:toxin ParE1/3/4